MTKSQMNEMEDAEDTASRIAAQLPEAEAELFECARAAVDRYNAAVIAVDKDVARDAGDHYDAIVWKLNGGTFFGCSADDESPGNRVAAHCAAPDGEAPKWGQAGRFLVTVEGIRAIVEADGMDGLGLDFHIVDHERPFISETGYRSDVCGGSPYGLTFEQFAARRFAALMDECGLKMVRDEYRSWRVALPAWVPALRDIPPVVRQEAGGQLAFVL